MSEDEKKPISQKEEDPKPAALKEPSILIIDTTDQHPPGRGVSM